MCLIDPCTQALDDFKSIRTSENCITNQYKLKKEKKMRFDKYSKFQHVYKISIVWGKTTTTKQ